MENIIYLGLIPLIFGLLLAISVKPAYKQQTAFSFILISSLVMLYLSVATIWNGIVSTGEVDILSVIFIKLAISPISAIPLAIIAIISGLTSFKMVIKNDNKNCIPLLFITLMAYLTTSINNLLSALILFIFTAVIFVHAAIKKSEIASPSGIILFSAFMYLSVASKFINKYTLWAFFTITLMLAIYNVLKLCSCLKNKSCTSEVRLSNYSILLLEFFALFFGMVYKYPSLISVSASALGLQIISCITAELIPMFKNESETMFEKILFVSPLMFVPATAGFTSIMLALSGYISILPINPIVSGLLILTCTTIGLLSVIIFIQFCLQNCKKGGPVLNSNRKNMTNMLTCISLLLFNILTGLFPIGAVKVAIVPIASFIPENIRKNLFLIILNECKMITIFLIIFCSLIILYIATKIIILKLRKN